jgi:HEAT repeat protein
MVTKRTLTSAFFALTVTVTLMETGCSFESVPAERRRQNEAARDAFEREIQETSAASDRLRAQEMQRMMADPGSLSIEQSDAEIEALHSTSALRRISAAEKLGDAKGARAVDALVADLRSESDPAAFSAVVQALMNIHDARAVSAFVDALSVPNMPDRQREQAFNGIVEFGSAWRLVPQIERFYDSLTDESVRTRVRPLVEQYSKKKRAVH